MEAMTSNDVQMNYFGFRKIAGKGKMSPCSYVNEAAKEDISSLLFIKRKKTGTNAAAKLIAQQNRFNRQMAATGFNQFNVGGSLMQGNVNGGLGGQFAGGQGGQFDANTIGGLGALGGLQMAAAQAGMAANGPYNTKLPAEKRPNLHETALLREQQQMLAQLQQAHASATNAVTPGH